MLSWCRDNATQNMVDPHDRHRLTIQICSPARMELITQDQQTLPECQSLHHNPRVLVGDYPGPAGSSTGSAVTATFRSSKEPTSKRSLA